MVLHFAGNRMKMQKPLFYNVVNLCTAEMKVDYCLSKLLCSEKKTKNIGRAPRS